MSTLSFDGQTHQVTLTGADGTVIGTWTAYNNVDSHASLRALDDGTYTMQDTTAPHSHPADANGPTARTASSGSTIPAIPASASIRGGPMRAAIPVRRTPPWAASAPRTTR